MIGSKIFGYSGSPLKRLVCFRFITNVIPPCFIFFRSLIDVDFSLAIFSCLGNQHRALKTSWYLQVITCTFDWMVFFIWSEKLKLLSRDLTKQRRFECHFSSTISTLLSKRITISYYTEWNALSVALVELLISNNEEVIQDQLCYSDILDR